MLWSFSPEIAAGANQESDHEGEFPARSLGVFFWMSIWIFILALPSCSLQKFAVDSLGKALAESSSVYATDDDPDLVDAAMPFGLKTIEGLLGAVPA